MGGKSENRLIRDSGTVSVIKVANGYATAMRGKSLTCRQQAAKNSGGLRPLSYLHVTHGKSKTCRASAWLNHGRRLCRRFNRFSGL